MELHSLIKTTTKKRRRLGQGHGSGRVKTSGRGTKGQNSRSSRPLLFEGGALPLSKRLPYLRGKGKNKVFRPKPLVINISDFSRLPKGSEITIETLIKYHVVKADEAKTRGVKILGDGELSEAFTVTISTSQSAKSKIEKAGGTVST